MIPADKVKKIIERYNFLEKELSTGKFDSKLFSFTFIINYTCSLHNLAFDAQGYFCIFQPLADQKCVGVSVVFFCLRKGFFSQSRTCCSS